MCECPKCGLKTSRIMETRQDGEGLRRRRKCPSCGSTWTTLEVAVEQDVINARDDIKRLLRETADVRVAVEDLLRQARRLEAEVYEKVPEPLRPPATI